MKSKDLLKRLSKEFSAWTVSKYGVISGPYLDTFHTVYWKNYLKDDISDWSTDHNNWKRLSKIIVPFLAWCQKQPPEIFCKKAFLKNFAIFTGKHLCWSLFLTKLQVLRSATLLKRDSNTSVFLWIYCEILKNYFDKHLQTAASDDVEEWQNIRC